MQSYDNHIRKCSVCGKEIFSRPNSYPICDECFEKEQDKELHTIGIAMVERHE